MIQQIALCLLVAVGIVMLSAEVSNAWHHLSGCGSAHGGGFGRHIRQPHRIYRHYEFRGGYGCHHYEYDRMRAMYGFINL
jgi:hypothetical protein